MPTISLHTKAIIWINVALHNEQIERARQIASLRGKPKRAAGVATRKMSGMSDQQIDVLGLEGEIAVADLLGCEIDERPLLGGDKGAPDLVWRDKKIEVKTRKKVGWDFITPLSSPELAKWDYVILVCAMSRAHCYQITGVISRADFITDYEQHDFGYGLHLVIPQRKMRSIVDFLMGEY